MADGGHTFVKKTFHKPTYCHHCSDLLWGLIGQGYICEVCNFIVHERCLSNVITPCSGIAPRIIKNPVAHCWSDAPYGKRKFCTVCRKRLDDSPSVHCIVCEYNAHLECQDFAVPDCTENATYVPDKDLSNVRHHHHWREGNLPNTSKCAHCKKTCTSSECLTGYRCEWCGLTTHGGCRVHLPSDCNFGVLQPIYLPPHAVSIPRTEVPVESIIGVQVKQTTLVREYSCPELSTINYSADSAIERTATTITTTSTKDANTPELSLREILLLERQRREISKQNFLLSSPTSSIASISPTLTPKPLRTTTTTTTLASQSSPIPTISATSLLIDETTTTTATTTATVKGAAGTDCQEQDEQDDDEDDADEEEQKNQTETTTEDSGALQLTNTNTNSSQKTSRRQQHQLQQQQQQQQQQNIQKSPSTSSSLHLFYTNIFRRMHHGHHHRRKHLSSNTDEDDECDCEDEGVGACDISGGDITDEYDNCDVALQKRRKKISQLGGVGVGVGGSGQGNVGSDASDYHGDADEAPTRRTPGESSFYETSDTGGDELTNTTDEIDSSMNLISSNLSYNSSNSNTSIENRHCIDKDNDKDNDKVNDKDKDNDKDKNKRSKNKNQQAQNAQLEAAIAAKKQQQPRSIVVATAATITTAQTSKTGAIPKATKSKLSPPKKKSTTALGSLSSPNSSDCSSPSPVPPTPPPVAPSSASPLSHSQLSPVGRSKSFQEPGVKQHTPTSRHKKYTRFFQRRRSKRSNKDGGGVKNDHSNFSLNAGGVTASQSIEITIQDEDGNFQPYDDNYCALSCGGSGRGGGGGRGRGRGRLCRSGLGVAHTDEDDYGDDDIDDIDDDFDEYADGDGDAAKLAAQYRQYLDHAPLCRGTGGGSSGLSDEPSYSSDNINSTNDHVFGRLMKRMRRISMGWRKPRYHKRRARSISEEFSSGDTPRLRDEESGSKTESTHGGSAAGCSSGGSSHYRPESTAGHKPDKADKEKEKKEKEREEKDIEMIKVFDGNNSFRRQLYRPIIVPRTYKLEQLLKTALRAFHITRDPSAFYLTDVYASNGNEDTPLQDPNPVLNLMHLENKRPAIFLRFHDRDNGFVRVYPGKLQCSVQDPYVSVPVDNTTVIKDLIRDALDRFGLQDNQIQDYRCSEVLLDRGVTERILSWNERPWDIMKQLGKESIRQMELMRFYMQHKQDPHGPNVALFVSNLPPGLSERNYEQILNKYVTEENRFISIGPIYYEYGSVILTFEDSQRAVRAFYNLQETIIEDKQLLVMLLPNIDPSMIPSDVRPLLVFVNVKSGGCQGLELISSFRKLLNPYQVFDLDNGGPLPGLYVFRQIANYKILVCGGDGTIGWVLQCLDNVGQDSECSSPPCAIVPLGTGNDLARVLCWGSGYTGGEDPLNLLRDVIEAEDIRLDRWTVVFHPEDKPEDPAIKQPSSNATGKKKKAHQAHLSQQTNQHHQLPAITSSDISGGGAQNEDNSQIFVMNNYFGIGLDADLCLDFHTARENNPDRFNSRLHNKGYYVKMGLRKIVGRRLVKDLHRHLRIEVDGNVIELPPVEGIIILNILSWGSGANPWGTERDNTFTTPNHYDGILEIVGVTGVVHLGQIQSGIRSANRIAQGGHIKIHLFCEMPVQVDGEPWIQAPGDVVVLKSALKATMLKKTRGRRRLTEPHISPAVMSMASQQQQQPATSAAAAQAQAGSGGGGGAGGGSGGGGSGSGPSTSAAALAQAQALAQLNQGGPSTSAAAQAAQAVLHAKTQPGQLQEAQGQAAPPANGDRDKESGGIGGT